MVAFSHGVHENGYNSGMLPTKFPAPTLLDCMASDGLLFIIVLLRTQTMNSPNLFHMYNRKMLPLSFTHIRQGEFNLYYSYNFIIYTFLRLINNQG